MHLSHPRQTRKATPVDSGEILGILGHDLQKIVGRARHEMAFQNIGDTRDLALERIENLFGLTLKRDLDEHDCLTSHFLRIEKRDISARAYGKRTGRD